jgi:hypothetical protein
MMNLATASEWETMDTWLPAIDVTVAFMRLAKRCCAAGGII